MVKYPLTTKQNKELKSVWKFIEYFSKIEGMSNDWFSRNGTIFGPFHYRNYIINLIKKNINENKFYEYEKIINKLYWNLKYKLMQYVENDTTQYHITNHQNILEISSRSNLNSYLQYNEKDNQWYFLDKLSELDNICMNIMRDVNKYSYYLKNPSNIKDYNKTNNLDTYYNFNYAFPNINPIFYNKNSKSYWIKKINLMYFHENDNKIDENWYKLIVPNQLLSQYKKMKFVHLNII